MGIGSLVAHQYF